MSIACIYKYICLYTSLTNFNTFYIHFKCISATFLVQLLIPIAYCLLPTADGLLPTVGLHATWTVRLNEAEAHKLIHIPTYCSRTCLPILTYRAT